MTLKASYKSATPNCMAQENFNRLMSCPLCKVVIPTYIVVHYNP